MPFTRYSFLELSIEATAKALGLTVAATKTRLFWARSFVRQEVRAAFQGAVTPAILRVVFR